jgi:hypothetical protein
MRDCANSLLSLTAGPHHTGPDECEDPEDRRHRLPEL